MRFNTKRIKKFAAVLALTVSVGTSALTAQAAHFDVNPGDWYYDTVQYVVNSQIMTGMDSTYFGAAELLSRSQFAVVLYRMAGQPAASYSPIYVDVGADTWYTDAVMWASQAGIVTGYQDGSGLFGIADPITREQMVTMMYRYAGYQGQDISAAANLASYPDAAAVSGFAYEPMQWSVAEGIISGDQGNLNPQGSTSRAVCATIIARFLQDGSGGTPGGGDASDGSTSGTPEDGDVSTSGGTPEGGDASNGSTPGSTPNGSDPSNGGTPEGGDVSNGSAPGTGDTGTPGGSTGPGSSTPGGSVVLPQKQDGTAVVAYARKFVGKLPYVSGGTSLTTGADCSGFVKSVYANFGVKLPRTTWEQEKAGVEVSYSNAEPGDLIFFANHVGIYSGNGKMIHSPVPGQYVSETRCSYMGTITHVRRVL